MPKKLILLVDDSPDDEFFFRRELKKAGLQNPVHSVESVDAAIGYLEGHGKYAERKQFPLPSVVVLDLNLPVKDGFEFLRCVRAKAHVRDLHVVVVTGVDRLEDINRAYEMGAGSFLTKPIRQDDLRKMAETFSAYWE